MKRRIRGRADTYVLRHFRCPGCGTERTAPKDQDTGAEHIKDMHCPICKAITKHVQYDAERIRLF